MRTQEIFTLSASIASELLKNEKEFKDTEIQ